VPDWLQQLVDKGGFAMVNVGDDGDIANFLDHELITCLE
jgi:hypothetical protein